MQTNILVCPVCRAPLTLDAPTNARGGGCYRCDNRHTFDRARQGYTNLLTGRVAGQHGDNAEMIDARRAFLNGGFYAPLCDALCKSAAEYLPPHGVLLDAGCGEGYYTNAVLNALLSLDATGYGIDISREALRCACQREAAKTGRLSLFVAGVYGMPFGDNSFDMVLNFFAPFADGEYRRVLKQNGVLIMAIPAAKHLWEMKSVLYDIPHENEVADFDIGGFTLTGEERVTIPMHLPSREMIHALFSMTPYYYRTPATGKARLEAYDTLDVTADFHLLVYRLNNII